MIGVISLTLLYWAVAMTLTMPLAAHPLQEVAKPLVGLVVAGAILAWLEKPWQRDYVYNSSERTRPVFMLSLITTALVVTIGWSSWQFIFWLN